MKTRILFLFPLLLAANLLSQPQTDVLKPRVRYGFEVNRKPAVVFNVFVDYTAQEWHPQVQVALAMMNDVLQFELQDGRYRANYQVTVALRREGTAVLQEIWSREVWLDSFEETNARRTYQYDRYIMQDLLPTGSRELSDGTYQCLLEVTDLVTRKSYKSSRKIEVNRAAEPFPSSAITFLEGHCEGNDTLPLAPLTSTLEYNRPYAAYLRLKSGTNDSLRFNVRFYSRNEEGDQLVRQTYFSRAGRDSVHTVCYPLPYKELEEGAYRLRFSAEIGEKHFESEREVAIVWFEKPVYLYKADLAIRPMRYILPEEEFERVRDLKYQELEQWLTAYWDERDPSPDTEYNELLYEFFNRVDEANEKFFNRNREGWETDRGKVYILYGEPQQVENRRYAVSTLPYLVWIYEDGQTFVFVDKDKSGEFRLVEIEEEEE